MAGVKQSGIRFKDPAFPENKKQPIHRWIPWIAGFSAGFVDDVLRTYLDRKVNGHRALVLDPFSGVGTTLVQAALRGYDGVGFEINPYAALAARVKLNAARINVRRLDRAIRELRLATRDWRTCPAPPDVRPVRFKSRIPFFSPLVERQALHALAFIARAESAEVADLFRLAFGSIMVSFSNYTYEPSLSSRPGADKPLIEDADVAEILVAKVQQMRADIEWLKAEVGGDRRLGRGEVHNLDFFAGHGLLPPGSVRLVVTSPPYLNNYHYVRNTRPQLHWLNLLHSPKDQRHLEEHNFGKFWQTTRDAEPVALAFEHSELSQLLEKLRATRASAGIYGGAGWANYAATYFNDCDRFLKIVSRLLTGGGVGIIVIGNSIVQGFEIKVDRILGDLAASHGLRVEDIRCLRAKRVGASITQSAVRRGETNGSSLYEASVVLRKP